MLSSFKETYKKFSKDFWLLMTASFIDMLGGSLIFPFFSLYMTHKFDVGMVEVGTMFLVWALTSGLIGNTIGGALTDKFGRKTNIIFGLIASAVSALMMVLISFRRKKKISSGSSMNDCSVNRFPISMNTLRFLVIHLSRLNLWFSLNPI